MKSPRNHGIRTISRIGGSGIWSVNLCGYAGGSPNCQVSNSICQGATQPGVVSTGQIMGDDWC